MAKEIKLVFGAGYNDGSLGYSVTYIDQCTGKKRNTRAYSAWQSMIKRCYSNTHNRAGYYDKIGVCEDWLSFQKFAAWFEQVDRPEYAKDQEWYVMDKDLKGGVQYSPETVLLIPNFLNVAIGSRHKSISQKTYNKCVNQVNRGLLTKEVLELLVPYLNEEKLNK